MICYSDGRTYEYVEGVWEKDVKEYISTYVKAVTAVLLHLCLVLFYN
jgi:hypothetical protein